MCYRFPIDARQLAIKPKLVGLTRMSDMQGCGARLASFAGSSINSPEFTISLARAGFSYFGKGDAVICNVCRVKYQGWQQGDRPLEIHAALSPACPLANELLIIRLGELFPPDSQTSDQPGTISDNNVSSVRQAVVAVPSPATPVTQSQTSGIHQNAVLNSNVLINFRHGYAPAPIQDESEESDISVH